VVWPSTGRPRGVHSLPGRPWFGRALLDYSAWALQSGYSARREQDREGSG
jgi:hypothetical protein